MRPSSPPPPLDTVPLPTEHNLDEPPHAELVRLIRKNLLAALGSLIVLGGIAALLMIRFRPQLDMVTEAVFAQVGIGGLVALLFFTDAFVSPFPPDSVLILIAASPYHDSWMTLIPSIGLVSSAAGAVGYTCGSYLSHKSWAVTSVGSFRRKSERMIHRYGSWGVAIGALTPLPFSITCWGAGLLHVPFRKIWFSLLLRIPRYFVYYAVIAYAPQIWG